MKLKSLILSSLALVCLAAAVWRTTPPVESQAPGNNPAALFAFSDSADINVIPSNWTGPKFQLSHNYPKTKPQCQAPWLKRQVDFTNKNSQWSDWQGYVQDIINYVKEGQDPNMPDNLGWRSDVGGQTRWYHIPWMAYDTHGGREFVHGLTNELSTALNTFLDESSGTRASGKTVLAGASKVNGANPLFETWSVGMYNPCGAWSVGQAFPASGAPATFTQNSRLRARGLPFAEGTVVMKLLNTTADATFVKYLQGSTSWQANGHQKLVPVPTKDTDYTKYDRAITTVHLIQVDLAVIDPRSPTRWVYSTLAYDGTSTGATVWDRLVPLGIEWGSDPGTFPAVPQNQSSPPWQSIIAPTNLPEHYGCMKRLAGVVDNAASSCVSCHMGAYAAPPGVLSIQGKTIPSIFVPMSTCTTYSSTTSAAYFSNYKFPMPYPGSTSPIKDAIPLDSSLQLQVAFAQYAKFMHGQQ